MSTSIKIAIPMAGLGTRMRPHTWSKPKPLIGLAGRTVLDYLLEQFNSLPDFKNAEFIFIVGSNQLEQIQAHTQLHSSRKKSGVRHSGKNARSVGCALSGKGTPERSHADVFFGYIN